MIKNGCGGGGARGPLLKGLARRLWKHHEPNILIHFIAVSQKSLSATIPIVVFSVRLCSLLFVRLYYHYDYYDYDYYDYDFTFLALRHCVYTVKTWWSSRTISIRLQYRSFYLPPLVLITTTTTPLAQECT
jgi:hypothetical protein